MVIKKRRWRWRRDGIHQRYWYGRKPKRRKIRKSKLYWSENLPLEEKERTRAQIKGYFFEEHGRFPGEFDKEDTAELRKRRSKSVTVHEKLKKENTGEFNEFEFESAKRDKHRPYIVRRYAREPTIEDIGEISRFEKFGRKGEITIPKEKAEKALGKAALVASVHPDIPPPVAHLIDVTKFNVSEDITFGGKKEPTQKDIQKLLEKEGFK